MPKGGALGDKALLVAPFFGLTFAFAIPFWIAGARAKRLALPGLPSVDALMVLCPLLSASLLTWSRDGARTVERLLRSAVDIKRIRSAAWYAPSLLLAPGASLISDLWIRERDGTRWTGTTVTHVVLLFALFLLGAASEEVGWTAYATTRLRRSASLLTTALLIGAAEAAWHFVPLAQIGRSFAWIGWWCAWTVSARVLMVYLYDETASVLTTVLFTRA